MMPISNSDGTECCPEKCISKKGDQKDNFNHDIFFTNSPFVPD